MAGYHRIKRMICLVLAAAMCVSGFGMSAGARSKKRSKTPGTTTIQAPDGTVRRYLRYKQTINYRTGRFSKKGASRGCVVTATAIAASGFGVYVSPTAIHEGAADAAYSERYALQKLNLMYHSGQVYTPYLSAQILRDMGIPARYVPVYEKDAAEREITAHLSAGKPVIVMTKKTRWNRIQIARWRHAIVLVHLGGNGTITYINPNASVNGTAHTGKRRNVRLTVRQLLDHFMYSSSGNYAKAYNPSNCGGYILVG